MATVVLLLRSQRRRERSSKIARGPWDRMDALPGMRIGDPSRGPDYRTWVNLRRQSKFGNGRRLRFYKQQQILKESDIECAKGGFTKWYPNRDEWNLYKGPESHPDNPWFPARSPGYGKALLGWAPAPMAASTSKSGTTGIFTGSGAASFGHSAKHPVRGARSSGSALVLHAHKKAASSSKNQGHKKNPHYWGLTKKAYQGNAVKAGQLLIKQRGMKWYNGANVSRGKDYSLHAIRDGIVQWRGKWEHREVMVIPWEYVREKCTWINANTLAPKEYEPWMNKHERGKRHYINNLRKNWLKTEEGQEWFQKKRSKAKEQKVIQQKIREHAKLRRVAKVSTRSDSRESVAAGGESESEAES